MFKEELMTALKSAVDNYNKGMSDDAAVIKAAEAHDFNQDQAQRLLESYNTTKTVCFFKTADDRTVHFTTADPEKVMTELFSQDALHNRKEASVKAASVDGVYDYSCYDTPEYGLDKAAESLPDEPVEYFDKDFNSIYRRAQKYISGINKTAEYARDTANMCNVKYQQIMTKLAGHITRDYHYNGDKYGDCVEYMNIALDKQADAVIQDLNAYLPDTYRGKTASSNFVSTFDTDEPEMAALIKDAADMKLQGTQMRVCAAEFEDMAKEAEAEFKAAAELKDPEPEEDFFSEGFKKRAQAADSRKSGPALSMVSISSGGKSGVDPIGGLFGITTKGVGEPLGKNIAKGVESVMAGPQIREKEKASDKLRNLQRQMILEDLITNDPVLGNVDPGVVMNGYQTILKVAPKVSLNKEVVRSILRASSNAEATSPYDAKVLAELETQIRKQTDTTPKDKDKEGGKQ